MKEEMTFTYELMMEIVEDAPVGIIFMENTRVVNLNKYAIGLLEYTDKEEVINLHASDFSPEYQPNGKLSSILADEYFSKALNDGYNRFDWVHITKSGKKRWFEVTLKQLVKNSSKLAAYLKEITQEKKMEYRFNKFMDHLPASAYIKNEKLEYIYINNSAKKLANVKIDDEEFVLRKYTVKNLLSADISEHIENDDKKVMKTGVSSESLIKFPDKDGIDHCYRNIKFSFEDADYERYIGGVFLDITDLTKANKRIKTVVESLITTIQSITEERDPYTSGHEVRVSSLSIEIGKLLGLSKNQLEGLRIGALIHDLGKIHVPLDLLNKPGKLTKNQLDLVRDHAEVGYKIVKPVKFEWPIHQMVRHHHEKYDGSGYPDGLSGDNILIEARIICVADVIEAMSSHRPYRPAKPMSEAIDELRNGKGTRYDPKVVDACLKVIKMGTYNLKGWVIKA